MHITRGHVEGMSLTKSWSLDLCFPTWNFDIFYGPASPPPSPPPCLISQIVTNSDETQMECEKQKFVGEFMVQWSEYLILCTRKHWNSGKKWKSRMKSYFCSALYTCHTSWHFYWTPFPSPEWHTLLCMAPWFFKQVVVLSSWGIRYLVNECHRVVRVVSPAFFSRFYISLVS